MRKRTRKSVSQDRPSCGPACNFNGPPAEGRRSPPAGSVITRITRDRVGRSGLAGHSARKRLFRRASLAESARFSSPPPPPPRVYVPRLGIMNYFYAATKTTLIPFIGGPRLLKETRVTRLAPPPPPDAPVDAISASECFFRGGCCSPLPFSSSSFFLCSSRAATLPPFPPDRPRCSPRPSRGPFPVSKRNFASRDHDTRETST